MDTLSIIINAIAGFNAFVLFSLLIFRKNNSLPNVAISIIMIIPAIYFSNSIVMLLGKGPQFNLLFFIGQYIAIFYTPFISIYVFALLGKSIKKLIPIFVCCFLIGGIPIFLYIQYLNSSPDFQNSFFKQIVEGPYPFAVEMYSLIFYSFQQLVFIGLLVLVLRIKKRVLDSNLGKTKLLYLQNFMILLVVLNFFIVLLYFVFDVLFVEYFLLPIIVGTIYTFIVYNAFKNSTIYTKNDYHIHLKVTQEVVSNNAKNYDRLNVDKVIDEISRAFDESELYKDHQLTISKLSDHIGRQSNMVSQIINQELNSNFFDLVNSRRVDEAVKLLGKDNKLTIEAVGFDVGFNSRSAFYRAFKKYKQITPTEFIQQTMG